MPLTSFAVALAVERPMSKARVDRLSLRRTQLLLSAAM